MTERIGFTTTIPVEIILAAGKIPVDLNNIFINDEEPLKLIKEAEEAGFPNNICGWIKGIYAAANKHSINKIIGVTQGDCSNTHALMEIFENSGKEVIPFAYPYDGDYALLKLQIEELMEYFNVDWDMVEQVRTNLIPLRRKLRTLDEKTYTNGTFTGLENLLYLVSSSDFNGDVEKFTHTIDQLLSKKIPPRPDFKNNLRLGYLGVPPIMSNLHQFLESQGASIIFNEIPRQFAMLDDNPDLITQYRNYTYPYKVFGRIDDIKLAIQERRLQGLIHYTQSFCFRQLEDIIIRQHINIPILTIEGDTPKPLDARTRLRLESFCETLKAKAGGKS